MIFSRLYNSCVLIFESHDVTEASKCSFNALQPPCAFYEKIILDGGYSKSVTIVTSPTTGPSRNPCLSYLTEKFEASVQSADVISDFAALANGVLVGNVKRAASLIASSYYENKRRMAKPNGKYADCS